MSFFNLFTRSIKNVQNSLKFSVNFAILEKISKNFAAAGDM